MRAGGDDAGAGQHFRRLVLGPTLERRGVNFALFSANASQVELCLFDASRHYAETRVTPAGMVMDTGFD